MKRKVLQGKKREKRVSFVIDKLIENLQRIGFVVARNSCNHAVRSGEGKRIIPVVYISAQGATSGDETRYSATFELPLSISSTVATFRTGEKIVAVTMESHVLVKLMHKVVLKFCALPLVYGWIIRWVGCALEFPDSVRIIIAIVTRHSGNRLSHGAVNIDISLRNVRQRIFFRTQ